MRWSFGAAVCLVGVFAPTVAWACTCGADLCTNEVFVGDVLPANVEGLTWRTSWTVDGQEGAEQVLALERKQPDGSFMEVPFRWSYNEWPDWPTVAPDGGFEQGVTYRVSNREAGVWEVCNTGEDEGVDVELVNQTFEVGAPVTSFELDVEVGEEVRQVVPFGSSSCEDFIEAVSRTVRVEAPGELDDVLEFFLFVDGEPFYHSPSTCTFRESGALGQSRHEAIVPVACEEWPVGLDEGSHTIQVKARLRGSDVWFTGESQTLEWRCEPPEAPSTSGGSNSGCSQGGGAPSRGVAVFGLVAVCGLLFRRRRA